MAQDDDYEYEYTSEGDEEEEINVKKAITVIRDSKLKTEEDKFENSIRKIMSNTYEVPLHVKNLLIKQFKICISEGYSVQLVHDNIVQWILDLNREYLDTDSDLFKDMIKYSIPCIQIEISYPISYPNSPPYCRVIKPIFVFHTGHVLIDGAICNEILATSGWNPVIQPDQLFKLIASFLTEGKGRIDSTNLRGEYSHDASRTAFKRMLQIHGW